MIFKIGKYYKHKNVNKKVAIRKSFVPTTQWGSCLVGEVIGENQIITLGPFKKDDAINWIEITEEEWLKHVENCSDINGYMKHFNLTEEKSIEEDKARKRSEENQIAYLTHEILKKILNSLKTTNPLE